MILSVGELLTAQRGPDNFDFLHSFRWIIFRAPLLTFVQHFEWFVGLFSNYLLVIASRLIVSLKSIWLRVWLVGLERVAVVELFFDSILLVIWRLVIIVTDLFLWTRTVYRIDVALVGFFQGSLRRSCQFVIFLSWEYDILSAYYLSSICICGLRFLLRTAFCWFLNDVAFLLTLAALIVERRVIVIVSGTSTAILI